MPVETDSQNLRQLCASLAQRLWQLWDETVAVAQAEFRVARWSVIVAIAGLAGALLIAASGILVLVSALVLIAIALGLSAWAAALIVGVLLVAIAAAVAYICIDRLRRAPLGLPDTRATLNETLAWLKMETFK
jgi:hypothetical protein